MDNCDLLKLTRKKLGMTQKEFAILAGVSPRTIWKLEQDEMVWSTILPITYDKIDTAIKNEIPNMMISKEEYELLINKIYTENDNDELTDNDKLILNILSFAIKGLKESKNHNEFIANIKIIKRTLKEY